MKVTDYTVSLHYTLEIILWCYFKAGFHMITDDRRSQKVLRSSAIKWKQTSAIVCDRDRRRSQKIEPCSIFCDRMETKVPWSAIETYPIIFLILTHDSTLLNRKARMFVYSNVHIEHRNVTKEEFMEEVARYECVYNRNKNCFFIKRIDKGWIATEKDLESSGFER